MRSLFEQAFLKAAGRYRIHHLPRRSCPIRSLHQACAVRYPKGLIPAGEEDPDKALNKRNKPDDNSMQEYGPLMRGGFGNVVKCTIQLSYGKI
jgi:hypothetical protein